MEREGGRGEIKERERKRQDIPAKISREWDTKFVLGLLNYTCSHRHVPLHFRVQVWVRVLKAEIVRSFPRLKQLSRYNIFCFWLRNRSSITVHLRVFRDRMVMLLSSLGWMANVLATLLEQISFLGKVFRKCGKFTDALCPSEKKEMLYVLLLCHFILCLMH